MSITAAKALQIAAAQMPESSDSVVRAMLDLVAQQSDVIVGLTSVVSNYRNLLLFFSQKRLRCKL